MEGVKTLSMVQSIPHLAPRELRRSLGVTSALVGALSHTNQLAAAAGQEPLHWSSGCGRRRAVGVCQAI